MMSDLPYWTVSNRDRVARIATVFARERQMTHPLFFRRMLLMWVSWPRVLDDAIAAGLAAREPRPGWLPVKGRSTISDLWRPEVYGAPGLAQRLNREARKLHRRIRISAFISGMSRSQIESHLEAHGLLISALDIARHRDGPGVG
jgi:hypothetical protein